VGRDAAHSLGKVRSGWWCRWECPSVHFYPFVKIRFQLVRWLFVPCNLPSLAKTSNETEQAPCSENRERPRSVIHNNCQVSMRHGNRLGWRCRSDKILFAARHCISFGRSQFPFKGRNCSYYPCVSKVNVALVYSPQITSSHHVGHSQVSIIRDGKRR